MRKSFLCMMRKNIPLISIILLVITGIIITGASVTVKLKASDTPRMYVNPAAIDTNGIDLGTTFMINVSVANVDTGMLGYWFKLQFDKTIVWPTKVIPRYSTETPPGVNPPGATLAPLKNINGTWTWAPLQYASQGYVYIMAYWISPPFTGSGAMMSINFTALAPGNSTLHLYDTRLGDAFGNPIDHTTGDGWAHVVPEFPAIAIAPLLMITTLTAALLGKIWSKKRRGPAVA